MNFAGIIVGLATFLIIGVFHPIVIKAEYYLGTRCWWMFLLAGIIFGALSLLVTDLIFSTILGVTAFSSFWSIHELKEQKERVTSNSVNNLNTSKVSSSEQIFCLNFSNDTTSKSLSSNFNGFFIIE